MGSYEKKGTFFWKMSKVAIDILIISRYYWVDVYPLLFLWPNDSNKHNGVECSTYPETFDS